MSSGLPLDVTTRAWSAPAMSAKRNEALPEERNDQTLPVIPASTREQILAMHEVGRRIGDEIAERIAPLFVIREEDLRFRHE